MENDMECNGFKSVEHFLSPCSSSVEDIFGDPLVPARVGDRYQAEIPPLMMDYCCPWPMQKLTDAEVLTDFPNYFALGLPVPIMWAQAEVKNLKKEAMEVQANQHYAVDVNWTLEVETSEDRHITPDNQDPKVPITPLNAPLDNGEEVGLSTPRPMLIGDKINVDMDAEKDKNTKVDLADNAYCPLPGSQGKPWRPIEHDSFLLGLYSFGKNLVLVKRFVNSREMGDLLSYYYGKFYRSIEYRRWSENRKVRSRRCVRGQKIFTGWRQQEMLSRVFSHVSEECQSTLRELSRAFGEGKLSMEEYVFTLEDTVGINILVEAVGIGKGKQDLTGTAMDPMKTNSASSVHPRVRKRKACSSLTLEEITTLLTGDTRLSKARSNDLFWEAVWPRLLARGWHSEQPKNYCFVSAKHSLVFLVPGVNKFSRRRLIKGNHYFDCVSDVLNKVASDPGLLEIEIEASEGSRHKEECLSDLLVKQFPDSDSNWQRHCYLQPPVSHCKADLVKFTIVDTSLTRGEQSTVREMRTLPVDTAHASLLSDISSEAEQDSSEESQDKSVEINALDPAEDTTDCGNGMPSAPDHMFMDSKINEEESPCESLEFQVGPSLTLSSCSSLARGNQNESDQGIVDGNCLDTEPTSQNHQPQTMMIDLNLPHVFEDPGSDETPITDTVQNHDYSGTNTSHIQSETSQQSCNGGASMEQEPPLNGRRQSTRNRPLTTKALEAIACGFLNTKRKRKSVDGQSGSVSRSSHHVRSRHAAASSIPNGNRNDDSA